MVAHRRIIPVSEVRHEVYDDYPTRVGDARYLTSLLPVKPGSTVLEPCANKGNFITAIRLEVPDVRVWAIELQGKYKTTLQSMGLEGVKIDNFLTLETKRHWDWVITNPPFTGNTGIAFVRKALQVADNVAMLLPLRYLSSNKRRRFWKETPIRHFWSIAERPVFVGSKGGRTDLAWYWWRQGYKGRPTFDVISLEE